MGVWNAINSFVKSLLVLIVSDLLTSLLISMNSHDPIIFDCCKNVAPFLEIVGLLDSIHDLINRLEIIPVNIERANPILWLTPNSERNVEYFRGFSWDIRNLDQGHDGVLLFLLCNLAAAIHNL